MELTTGKAVFEIAAEKLFENKIKKFLDDNGAYYVKFFANAFTKTGVPDILCCVNGYFGGIEVKAQNGRPSELQLYNIRQIKDAGGFAFVLYPSAFEQFKEFIIDLKREKFNRDYIKEIWR